MGDNMLIKFTVENYKNFKEPITLDFSVQHDYKFNPKCVHNDLLSKVVIYGPNASGKSNLGLGVFDIVGLLTDKNIEKTQLDEMSFINSDSDSKVAKFEYNFKKESSVIRYIYHKTMPQKLVFEELYIDDVKIFSYDFVAKKGIFDNMQLIDCKSLNFDFFENNLAILRYVANNTIQGPNSYVRFIMNFVSKMLWFRSLQNNSYIGLTTGVDNLSPWLIENNLIGEFQKFLHDMAGIDMKLGVATVTAPEPIKLLVEEHKKNPLIFENTASSGTRALQLLFYWSRRFSDVSFLFIDEFDAFYHFELARNVLRYIYELDNVQAVFTTHNSYLASNSLLRPDCYFQLSNGQLKSFADSTERELREGHNLEKLLRNGEFDA